MYDMDMRDYDPAIARWLNVDPVVHYSQSTYNAYDCNPVYFADPSGAEGHGMVNDNSEYFFNHDSQGRNKFDWNGMFIPMGYRADADSSVDYSDPYFEYSYSSLEKEESEGDEPPVNFFDANDPNQQVFMDVFNENNKVGNYQIGDNVFTVYAHGSNIHIGDQTKTDGGKKDSIPLMSAKDFDRAMSAKSPAYKKAIESGQPFVITLYSCYSAAGKESMAAKLSKAHKNATIIGFDGYVFYGTNSSGRPAIQGISNYSSFNDYSGNMITYRGGMIIGSIKFSKLAPFINAGIW